jgi:hypothetical protein
VADDSQAMGLLASSGGLAGLDPMAAAVRRPPSGSSAGGPLGIQWAQPTCTWSPCKASTRRPTAAASGPCQRFARNCATRNLAPPHAPIPGSALHLDGCVATGVSARRREPPAHRWHARGQGFKSPQLHPRSEAMFGPGHPGISGLGQQIGSNPACTASPGYRSGRGADRSCRAGTVVQPDAEGR